MAQVSFWDGDLRRKSQLYDLQWRGTPSQNRTCAALSGTGAILSSTGAILSGTEQYRRHSERYRHHFEQDLLHQPAATRLRRYPESTPRLHGGTNPHTLPKNLSGIRTSSRIPAIEGLFQAQGGRMMDWRRRARGVQASQSRTGRWLTVRKRR